MTRQRVAISGASGLIGSALSRVLAARGDEVRPLVRREVRADNEITWDPVARTLDPEALTDVDAVVHLAGAGVADKRWSPAYQQEILRSRSDGTATVAGAVAAHGDRIRLVSGSAVGIYGSNRGAEVLTEESAPGEGFLADVVRAWEAATQVAVDAGAPVALARTGLVMATGAGAFAPLIRLGRLGLGGPLGSGKQYWPWITLGDEVRALLHLVDHREITGPVNLVGPDPVPQIEVSREIGRQLGRPSILPAPAFALRIIVGGFASDILGSQRVMPTVLTGSGFAYADGTLAEAVATLL